MFSLEKGKVQGDPIAAPTSACRQGFKEMELGSLRRCVAGEQQTKVINTGSDLIKGKRFPHKGS